SGTLSQLNAALASVTYLPNLNFNGSDTLNVTTNDEGNTGIGGPQVAHSTVTIAISAVNDAPVNSGTGPQTIHAETRLTFPAANGNPISVSDVDANGGDEQVTLSVANGVLTLGSSGAVSFSVGDGTADATMTFSGTLAALNAALAGLTYLPNLNFNG